MNLNLFDSNLGGHFKTLVNYALLIRYANVRKREWSNWVYGWPTLKRQPYQIRREIKWNILSLARFHSRCVFSAKIQTCNSARLHLYWCNLVSCSIFILFSTKLQEFFIVLAIFSRNSCFYLLIADYIPINFYIYTHCNSWILLRFSSSFCLIKWCLMTGLEGSFKILTQTPILLVLIQTQLRGKEIYQETQASIVNYPPEFAVSFLWNCFVDVMKFWLIYM